MLRIDELTVAYPTDGGSHPAVRDVSLEVRPGEFFTLLGPSGCGKTTTLRSVAGLEVPQQGRIAIGGTPVFDAARRLMVPPQRRNIAMVFQSYAVWPHMTVAENVAFPLHALGVPKRTAQPRVREVLALVGLEGLAERSATQLSGGQQQRVALARAIVKGAELLLLDEPLSNLDAKLRDQMRVELRSLQHQLGQTTLYVTHDQEEALSLSDRIALMHRGAVVEQGTPQELYLRPRHLTTARFIGQAVFLPCRAVTPMGDGVQVQTALGALTVTEPPVERCDLLLLRPEQIRILAAGEAPAGNVVEGTVAEVLFSGKMVEYTVHTAGPALTVQAAAQALLRTGERVRLHLPPERCVLLADEA